MPMHHFFSKLILRLCLIGFGVLLFSISFAFMTWIYIKNAVRGKEVFVPQLLGMTEDQAREKIEDLGLILEIDNSAAVYSTVIERNRVLLQIPKAGRKIKAGRLVEITLSSGSETKLVPDLKGQTLDFSKTLLRKVEVTPSVISRVPSRMDKKGRVLDQNPLSGEEIDPRRGASLLISDGPPETWYVTPDLVGREYSRVRQFLDQWQFRVVTKFKTQDENMGQIVLQQSPKAGYPIKNSQTITVVVNKDAY